MWWQASQQGFSSLQQGCKSQFFWDPQDFIFHGPGTTPSLEDQDYLKNPSKSNAVEFTARYTLLFRKRKHGEAGLWPPSRVLPSLLALAAPSVRWMCPPAAHPSVHWALFGSTQRTTSVPSPWPQDTCLPSDVTPTSSYLDGKFQAFEMLSSVIFTRFELLL